VKKLAFAASSNQQSINNPEINQRVKIAAKELIQ
jgi:hypothetical protein